MKTGIVDVGGGLRGIYAAGVLDCCLDAGIRFDMAIGVSAGSANIASYLAGQRGRNYRFYTEYAFRKEYMGAKNMLARGSYIDLDYIYGTLSASGGESPLDYRALADNPAELLVVATNALTGGAKYFDKSDMAQDRYDIFKASSALPFVCAPYVISRMPYYDGALADPVPIAKAIECGCDRVVLLLTRPTDRLRAVGKDDFFARRIQRRYPFAARKLRTRAERYNASVALAKRYAAEGRVLIVAPDDTCGVDTLTRDKAALKRLYRKGLRDGRAVQAFLSGGGV